MLLFITGVPGSGKTYYSLHKIYKDFIKTEKAHYNYLYTNIAMFKFQISERFREFKNDDFIEKIKDLYALYKTNASEIELIDKAKQLQIFNSFFVIDEAHNFFDKERPELVFFLTYHRHFNCDIYLISQNLLLIHYKYRYLAEYFVKAKNRSISLTNKVFSYNYFADDKFYDRLQSVTLPKLKEVFELYQSGDIVRSKNYITKFLFYVFVLVVLAVVGFKVYVNHFFPSPSKKVQVSHLKNNTVYKNNINNSSVVNSKSFYFRCFGSYCLIKNKYYSITFLKFLKCRFSAVNNHIFAVCPSSNAFLSNLLNPKKRYSREKNPIPINSDK